MRISDWSSDVCSSDLVVLSHLHFDHAGGLLAPWSEGRAPELLFPNATFLVGAEQWQRARHPHPRDRASYIPELPGLLEDSGRLEIVEGDRSRTLGDAVRFEYSDGHTPGLMLAEIVGPERVDGQAHGGVVFCADLVPGKPWVHVPITMGYDRNAELLIDEKRAFLEDKLARNVHLFFTHDPAVARARVGGPGRGEGRGQGGFVVCAGLVAGKPWVHVPITMGYDRNAELLIDEKRAFLEDKLARNVHLFFTHDPGVALVQLVRDERGRFGTTHETAGLQARVLG